MLMPGDKVRLIRNLGDYDSAREGDVGVVLDTPHWSNPAEWVAIRMLKNMPGFSLGARKVDDSRWEVIESGNLSKLMKIRDEVLR